MAHDSESRPDDDAVSIADHTDHAVELDVDGLPEGALAIDYFESEPRVIVRGDTVTVTDLTDEPAVEEIVAVQPSTGTNGGA